MFYGSIMMASRRASLPISSIKSTQRNSKKLPNLKRKTRTMGTYWDPHREPHLGQPSSTQRSSKDLLNLEADGSVLGSAMGTISGSNLENPTSGPAKGSMIRADCRQIVNLLPSSAACDLPTELLRWPHFQPPYYWLHC